MVSVINPDACILARHSSSQNIVWVQILSNFTFNAKGYQKLINQLENAKLSSSENHLMDYFCQLNPSNKIRGVSRIFET